MVSARLAAEAVLADPADPGPAYTEALAAAFGGDMPGAAALQMALLRRPRVASAGIRLADRARGAPGAWPARGRSTGWPGGWRPAAPVRRERGPGAANGGAVCGTGPQGRSSAPRPAAVTGSVAGWPGPPGPAWMTPA